MSSNITQPMVVSLSEIGQEGLYKNEIYNAFLVSRGRHQNTLQAKEAARYAFDVIYPQIMKIIDTTPWNVSSVPFDLEGSLYFKEEVKKLHPTIALNDYVQELMMLIETRFRNGFACQVNSYTRKFEIGWA